MANNRYNGGHGKDKCGKYRCKGGCGKAIGKLAYPKSQDNVIGIRTTNGRTSILKEEFNGLTREPESQKVLSGKLSNLNRMNKDAVKTFDQLYPVKKVVDEVKSGFVEKDPVRRRHLREQLEEYCQKGDQGNADSVLFQLIRSLYNHRTEVPKILWQIKDLPELEKEKDTYDSVQIYLKRFKPSEAA